MNNKKHIDELHTEIKEWKSEVAFLKDELKSFESRLSEVVSKNNDHEVMANAEHFQNQFIRHQEIVDQLAHDLNEKDQSYMDEIKSNPVASDRRLLDDHTDLRSQIEVNKNIYNELKSEFMRYAGKWM